MKPRLIWAQVYILVGCLMGAYLISMSALAADKQVVSPKATVSPRTTIPSKRIALVIGNASYPKDSLPFTINDANDMASTLSKAGFDVTVATNVTLKQMLDVISEFIERAKSAEVALFYFAGHGEGYVEGSVGENFLLPVDVLPGQGQGNLSTSIPVTAQLLKPLASSIAKRINILILDACRTKSVTRDPGTDRKFPSQSEGGFRTMVVPSGTFVAYGSAPGTAAFESPDAKHGRFTQSLLKHMVTQGITIEQVFKRVRSDVEQESNFTQSPSEESKLRGDQEFSFVDPALTKSGRHGNITHYAGRPDSDAQQPVLASQRDLLDRIQTIPAPSRMRALRELIQTRAPKLSTEDAERVLSYFWIPARRRALETMASQLPTSMPLSEVTRLIAKSTFHGYRETSMLPRDTFDKLKSLGKIAPEVQFTQLETALRAAPLVSRCVQDSAYATERDGISLLSQNKEVSETLVNRELLEIVENQAIDLDKRRDLVKKLFKNHQIELRFAEVFRILQALPEDARLAILTQDISRDALPDLLSWSQLTPILSLIKGDGNTIGDQGLQRYTTASYFIHQGMLDVNLSRPERVAIEAPLREELENLWKRVQASRTPPPNFGLSPERAAALRSAPDSVKKKIADSQRAMQEGMTSVAKTLEDSQLAPLLDPFMACN